MTEEKKIFVLLVEDDRRLAELTAEYLRAHGLEVAVERDGPAGLREALRFNYDLTLLDITLPGLSGIELLRKLRERKETPAIMITARGEEADRVLGLELGADDYLPKPFSPRELLARIHAVLRRATGKVGTERSVLRAGDLELDPGALSAVREGEPLELTAYEFQLLYALASHAGRVLTREQLMDLAGGNADEAFDRSIDVHISRLRRKLGEDPRQPSIIRTVRGLGYIFSTRDEKR